MAQLFQRQRQSTTALHNQTCRFFQIFSGVFQRIRVSDPTHDEASAVLEDPVHGHFWALAHPGTHTEKQHCATTPGFHSRFGNSEDRPPNMGKLQYSNPGSPLWQQKNHADLIHEVAVFNSLVDLHLILLCTFHYFQFTNWIQSWRKYHQHWSHLFWTDPGARLFIFKIFPQHKTTYKSYSTQSQKTDARKYFILYHYGGVFANLDVENLSPLEDILSRHSCILAQEPRAHRVLHDDESSFVPTPAFMACRPRHPFFKLVTELLDGYAKDFPSDATHSTGSKFLKDALDIYLNFKTSDEASDRVHVAPPEWFLPTFDPTQKGALNSTCAELYPELSSTRQEICDELKARNFANEPETISFTTSHWIHLTSPRFKPNRTVLVEQILDTVNVV